MRRLRAHDSSTSNRAYREVFRLSSRDAGDHVSEYQDYGGEWKGFGS